MKDHSTKAAAVKAKKVSRLMGRRAPRVGRAGRGRPRRRARSGRLPSRPAGRRVRRSASRPVSNRPAPGCWMPSRTSTPLTAADPGDGAVEGLAGRRARRGPPRPRAGPGAGPAGRRRRGSTSSMWSSSASADGGQQLLLEVELLGHPALGHDDEAAEGDQPGQRPTVAGEVLDQLLEPVGGPVVDRGQALDGVGLQGGEQRALGGEVRVHGPHRAVEATGQALDRQRIEAVLSRPPPGPRPGTPSAGRRDAGPVRDGLVLNHVQIMNDVQVRVKPPPGGPRLDRA